MNIKCVDSFIGDCGEKSQMIKTVAVIPISSVFLLKML